MRGLFVENGEVRFRGDLERPESRAGECRVEVLCAGVCATDLALVRGYMDFAGIPGHEFVGIARDGPLAGQRVVGEINAACGQCDACRAGLGRHCPERTVLGIQGRSGAFAEELCLPAANLHAVPEGVSTDAATFAEPVAAAFEIREQLDLASFERALVLGDGRLGLLCAQVLAASGVEVEIAGHHPDRRDRIGGGLAWVEPRGRRPYDLVVEATGSPDALTEALACVRPRGTVVLKTTSEAPATVDLAPVVIHEIQLLGSRCGPFGPALEALAAGSVEVEGLIDERYPLERGAEALAAAARPGVLKVLVQIGTH